MLVLRSTFLIRCHRQLRWPILARKNAGRNERIGFFLIGDGVYFYGRLPDNLAFVAAGPATRQAPTPPRRPS
jgi:hypothetical protein